MFELILKWPTVSHAVQTVSQRLRRLLSSLVMPLAVAAVVFFGLGLYWSIRPDIFDVREVALRQSGDDPKKLVPGAVTTATLIEVTTSLLEKKGGFLSNDINPVSLWLDNMPNWEFGALVQVRDFTRVLRNDFGRSQSQSKEDRDLATADPHFHFNNESWIFPTTEGQYRVGIEALNRYLVRLENGDARFFVRNDNLRFWLELVAKRLGDLAHRLSGSVGIEDLDTYAIWGLTDKAVRKSAKSLIKPRGYISTMCFTRHGVRLHVSNDAKVFLGQLEIPCKGAETTESRAFIDGLSADYGPTGLLGVISVDAGMTSKENADHLVTQGLDHIMVL